MSNLYPLPSWLSGGQQMWTTSQCVFVFVVIVIVIVIVDHTLIVGDIAHHVSHLYPASSKLGGDQMILCYC